MSRGYTPRHAQTARDLSFAVQFNDETLMGYGLMILDHEGIHAKVNTNES